MLGKWSRETWEMWETPSCVQNRNEKYDGCHNAALSNSMLFLSLIISSLKKEESDVLWLVITCSALHIHLFYTQLS